MGNGNVTLTVTENGKGKEVENNNRENVIGKTMNMLIEVNSILFANIKNNTIYHCLDIRYRIEKNVSEMQRLICCFGHLTYWFDRL
jgi:hypothetical protein